VSQPPRAAPESAAEAAAGLSRCAVVGAGAWGTALALAALRAGRATTLWGRDRAQIEAMRATRENARYLPGVALPPALRLTSDPADLRDADFVLLVVPAQSLRAVASTLADVVPVAVPTVCCAKGVERATGRLMHEVAREALPGRPVGVLSGPSFADDVGAGLPTAVTLAAPDGALAERLARAMASPGFRLYHTTDLRGAELGGAAKNVLAIACGVVEGRGLGASAKAALIARGFAEMSRLAKAYGARSETLMGLSGLGDLVLTCNSPQSRNFSLGLKLGQGLSPQEASAGGKLAEGAATAPALVEMARAKGVETPIAAAVADVLAGRLDVAGAIGALLARPTKAEE
jgi:glycerol-3-phosphate dehydrogenase (NAD(P)+)